MKRIALTTNLFLHEYIPEELYKQYVGREHILIGLLDDRLIKSDQKLRDLFGPVTINNWCDGGNRNESGLRIPGMKNYSLTSQHSFGRASDKLFRDADPIEVQQRIKKNWIQLGITGLELGCSWVHTDVRNNNNCGLISFNV
jgi:hypothetical protein